MSAAVQHRRQNWWSQYCTETYWAMRGQQDARLEDWAIGYETETSMFYADIEPKILFKDVLVLLRGYAAHLQRS